MKIKSMILAVAAVAVLSFAGIGIGNGGVSGCGPKVPGPYQPNICKPAA